jgi:UDP-N-acetylenolpyruvoylglucosamine reductase
VLGLVAVAHDAVQQAFDVDLEREIILLGAMPGDASA